jgi:hypothetical protein
VASPKRAAGRARLHRRAATTTLPPSARPGHRCGRDRNRSSAPRRSEPRVRAAAPRASRQLKVAFLVLPTTRAAPKLWWSRGLRSTFHADRSARCGPACATAGLSAKRHPKASWLPVCRAPGAASAIAVWNRRCGDRSVQWSKSRPQIPPARSLRAGTRSPPKAPELKPGAAPKAEAEAERAPVPAAERGSARQAPQAAPAETGVGRDTRLDPRSAGCQSGRRGRRARPRRSGRSSRPRTPRQRFPRAERWSSRDGSA